VLSLGPNRIRDIPADDILSDNDIALHHRSYTGKKHGVLFLVSEFWEIASLLDYALKELELKLLYRQQMLP
jgi:hypothetical protein